MRANEFIFEQTEAEHEQGRAGEHKDYEARAMAGAYVIPDASANFYQMYRYGIMMARAPDPQPDAFDDQTSLGDKMIVMPYSEGGVETMMAASKATGMAAKSISPYTHKDENEAVNRVSPVAKFKPTKRPSSRS
jgi:hypothetical protein